jgi:hypothetical protein
LKIENKKSLKIWLGQHGDEKGRVRVGSSSGLREETLQELESLQKHRASVSQKRFIALTQILESPALKIGRDECQGLHNEILEI